MKKICLQAGHQNCQYNSIIALRTSTGAPDEMRFNVDVRDTVAGELRKRGFEVFTTDSNGNDDKVITGQDFDMFLAIHYDADVYNASGGFVDFPEPSTDGATAESQRIAKILAGEYFATTGVANHPERSNANTRYYYMWKYLTAKTPCNLIECGVGWRVPDDHTLFTYSRPKVVEGIVRGICKAFSVPYEITPPTPEPAPQPSTTTPSTPPPATSPSIPSVPPETTTQPSTSEKLLGNIKTIVWGKGWPWSKINKIKELLPR